MIFWGGQKQPVTGTGHRSMVGVERTARLGSLTWLLSHNYDLRVQVCSSIKVLYGPALCRPHKLHYTCFSNKKETSFTSRPSCTNPIGASHSKTEALSHTLVLLYCHDSSLRRDAASNLEDQFHTLCVGRASLSSLRPLRNRSISSSTTMPRQADVDVATGKR